MSKRKQKDALNEFEKFIKKIRLNFITHFTKYENEHGTILCLDKHGIDFLFKKILNKLEEIKGGNDEQNRYK